jgi:hypothetical protein
MRASKVDTDPESGFAPLVWEGRALPTNDRVRPYESYSHTWARDTMLGANSHRRPVERVLGSHRYRAAPGGLQARLGARPC